MRGDRTQPKGIGGRQFRFNRSGETNNHRCTRGKHPTAKIETSVSPSDNKKQTERGGGGERMGGGGGGEGGGGVGGGGELGGAGEGVEEGVGGVCWCLSWGGGWKVEQGGVVGGGGRRGGGWGRRGEGACWERCLGVYPILSRGGSMPEGTRVDDGQGQGAESSMGAGVTSWEPYRRGERWLGGRKLRER